MSSLEQIVRPATAGGSPGVNIPVQRKASNPVLINILASTGVKTIQGSVNFSSTVYNKKFPREKNG